MKIPLHEAASRLELHPFNLLLRLSGLVSSLEECNPAVDDGYVETLRTLHGGFRAVSQANPDAPATMRRDKEPLGVSEGAARIIDKLERGDRWGGNSVSFDTLRNHYCRDVQDIQERVDELVERGLLSRNGRRGPLSLNPAMRNEVERIVSALRTR